MSRNEFLAALTDSLGGFPPSEVKRITDYYEEMFSEALEEGKSEEEICASFGSPSEIAERARVELAFLRAEQQPSANTLNPVLWIIIGLLALPIGIPLGIAVVSLIFAMVVAAFAVALAFCAVVIALGLSGFALVAGSIFALIEGSVHIGILFIGVALVLIGLSILAGMAVYSLIRAMIRGIVWVCRRIYENVSKLSKTRRAER